MNKQQLIDAVGERLGDRTVAAGAVEAVLDTVTGALADGERVALFGFGVFERVDRPARTARNPATGGTVEVPATSVPRFRPGQGLKDAVNGRSARKDGSTAARLAPAPAEDPATSGASSKAAKRTKPAKPPKAAKSGADGGAKAKAEGRKKGKKAKAKAKAK